MTVIDHPASARDLAVARRIGPVDLARHGESTALWSGERSVSYAELAVLVQRRAYELGAHRRLVALEMGHDVDTVVTFLAALHGCHPVMLLAEGSADGAVTEVYRPDVVVRSGGGVEHVTPVGDPSAHELHPELALLLSTSGSSGTPKMVRLSRENLESNAWSIVTYLGLTPSDVGATVLPLHYCYGLSVLTSHLAAGAAVVLTDLAVVDPCFWDLVARRRVSGIATVPHSLALVERAGHELLDVDSLRYVTQAGGRLEPDRVVGYAELGERSGWDFVVMYGQTEATARIAHLPPAEAARRPTSVGVAIPGGSISLDTATVTDADAGDDAIDAETGVGEVVYRGPNVMLGYATGPDDLARGREVDELRTGDLGRFDDDGYLHIVGRASRFVKIHGKRVDLDHLESVIADRLSDSTDPDRSDRPGSGDPSAVSGGAAGATADAVEVVCVGDDEGVAVVRVAPELEADAALDDELREIATSVLDVPSGRVVAVQVRELPRTGSSKIDRSALLATARSIAERPADHDEHGDQSVLDLYRTIFARDDIDPAESFASLGGDSFSYVECSIRLEALLGELPSDWHVQSIAALDERRAGSGPRRWGVQIETSVVLRAVCILLIVCTHMRLYRLPGGAHTLLAVVGYNFARFQLPASELPGRVRRMGSTIARIAVPTSVWIGLNMLLVGGYSLGAMLLVNNYTGDAARRGGRWEYWYFETFVQTMIVLAVLFSIGAVRRTERRAPFAFALAVLAATLAIRFDVVQWGGEYNEMFRPHTVACFVALGWAAAVCKTNWQRLLVTALTVVTSVGYFGQTDREWRIIVFVSALVWIPSIRLPARIAPVVTTIAAASMIIFLVHWQVWPLITPWFELHVAFASTIAVGVGAWWLYERARREVRDRAAARVAQRGRREAGRRTSSQVNDADTAIRTSEASPVSA